MSDSTVLITGASSGIGFHLAREFASNGHPLVLVAPDPDEIRAVCTGIASEFGVAVHAVDCDLKATDAVATIDSALRANDIRVDILVNNAGEGQKGRFWEVPIERHLALLELNVAAVLRLSAHLLPEMVERGHGRVLNLASVAGFEPGPLVAVYHATKAFILSWSEALAEELADTGVSVTTLCPGPTDTDFFPKAEMENTRAFQKAKLMAPQEVASAGYKATMAGDRVVVPGLANKSLVFARRVLPESMQAKLNEALYEDVDADDRKRQRGDVEQAAND